METGAVEIIIKGGKIPERDITFSLGIFPLFLAVWTFVFKL